MGGAHEGDGGRRGRGTPGKVQVVVLRGVGGKGGGWMRCVEGADERWRR